MHLMFKRREREITMRPFTPAAKISFWIPPMIAILCLHAPASSRAGEVVSALVPEPVRAIVGDTVTVRVQIDMTGADAPDHLLGSFTGAVTWDSTELIYLEHSGVGGGFTGNLNRIQTDRIVFNGANPTGSGGVVDVTGLAFEVADTGTLSLDLEYSAMAAAQTFNDLLGILTVQDTAVTGLAETILTMAVDPEEGGTTTPQPGPHVYADGDTVPVSAASSEGYYFTGWTGNVANPDTSVTTVVLNGDQTVTAHFSAYRTLTINVLPDAEYGTTDPTPGAHPYEDGEDVTVTAIADRASGARFKHWLGDAAESDTSITVTMDADKSITAVFQIESAVDAESEAAPEKLALHPNYPNPFNPETRIRYDLPSEMSVRLDIFNINGRLVRTLFRGVKPAGCHTEIWDGTTADGRAVTSGAYLLRMRSGEATLIRRMFLLR